TRGPHDLHHLVLAELDHLLVVVLETERHLRYRQTETVARIVPSVTAISELDAIVFPGQNLTKQSQAGPMVVIHHFAAHTPAPGALRSHHLLCECNRQRAHRLNCKST